MHLDFANSEYQYMVLHFLSVFFALELISEEIYSEKNNTSKIKKENKSTEKQKALTGFQADLNANPVITFQIGLTSTTRA